MLVFIVKYMFVFVVVPAIITQHVSFAFFMALNYVMLFKTYPNVCV